ncbi:MAG: AAA family ATPase, partial [Bacteroidota bacterium]
KAFLSTREVWDQEVISENDAVYRAEYLAFVMFQEGNFPENEEDFLLHVQQFMASRYEEGYIKGVHDADAAKILFALHSLHTQIGMLRYPTEVRACAQYFWESYLDKNTQKTFDSQLKGVGIIRKAFPNGGDQEALVEELTEVVEQFLTQSSVFPSEIVSKVANYLFDELSENTQFSISPEAAKTHEQFWDYLKRSGAKTSFEKSLNLLDEDSEDRFRLIRSWVRAFAEKNLPEHFEYADEVAILILEDSFKVAHIIEANTKVTLEDMRGSHPKISDKTYTLDFVDFMERVTTFKQTVAPKFKQYIHLKKELTDNYREALRLGEFKPRVLSSFVRNRLINEVYLPLIGDNLAKQMGVVGENKRTDLMGMLLLISPPGYGKTTLMEYVASRLGIIFMKINGPAIGHQVTSLDPQEAPNAGAREEVKKLNLAFEMGDNVMIYLDDIQHCNPEFLQKFISLCDGQRRIEGVYEGKPKTYDLRGRKVAVVMAGNPYTESGEKFQIPDMLSNRADTYNLGDMIGGNSTAFELSYVENSLTSNPILNALASRAQSDVYALVQAAQTDNREGMELEGNYASDEVSDFLAVFKKMLSVRDVILRNNMMYIESAAQSDQYRTEPPFKLQGSYRDMNKIAEKIVPIMTEEELQTLIFSHYKNEAQTLTTGAESNLLKFKEMNDLLSEGEKARWENIKTTFKENNRLKGLGDDQSLAQALAILSDFGKGLEGIRQEIGRVRG